MILRLFLARNTFSLETDIWQPRFQCWLISQTYFNLSLVVLGNDLSFFSLQFQDSYQDSYVLFFMYGFLVVTAKKMQRACKQVGCFSKPKKRWRQENKKHEVALLLPSSSPHRNICCNNEEFGVILVGFDCLWPSSDTSDHYEKQHNFPENRNNHCMRTPSKYNWSWEEKKERNSAVTGCYFSTS